MSTALVGLSNQPTFTSLCAAIRRRVDALELSFVQESLAIADMLVGAKAQYEQETGTGHGKGKASRVTSFVRATAAEIGRSPAFVQRLLTIARINPEVRRVIENAQGVSMAAMLDLAREADLGKSLKAATALVEGGRAALKEALSPLTSRRASDPAFDKLLKTIMDPTETLGGLPGEMPVPAGLVDAYPELGAYETMGDLRAAIKSGKVARQASRRRDDDGTVEPEARTPEEFVHVFMGWSRAEQDRFFALIGAAWIDTVLLGEEDIIDAQEPDRRGAKLRAVKPHRRTTSGNAASDLDSQRENFMIAMGMD